MIGRAREALSSYLRQPSPYEGYLFAILTVHDRLHQKLAEARRLRKQKHSFCLPYCLLCLVTAEKIPTNYPA